MEAQFVGHSRKYLVFILAALSLALTGVGCKKKKSSSNPPATEQVPDDSQNYDPNNNPAPVTASIGVVGQTGNILSASPYQQVRYQFELKNQDPAANYDMVLLEAPYGAYMGTNANGGQELVWLPSQVGDFTIKVLARNRNACLALNGNNAAQCQLPAYQDSSFAADSRYDVVQTFTVRVGNQSNDGSYPGNGSYYGSQPGYYDDYYYGNGGCGCG